VRVLLWFAGLLVFMATSMPETWGGRSANLFGTMICAFFFGMELRVAVDRWRRK